MRLGRLLLVLAAMLIALAAMLLGATSAQQAAPAQVRCDRFAAPSGSDSAPGTRERPFRTAQRLVRRLRPGWTGCLRTGTYRAGDRDYVMRITRAGRKGRPITVRSAPGGRARLIGAVWVARRAAHVHLSHLDIEGTGGLNTVKVYAKHTRLERNRITNRLRGESCLILGSSYAGRARHTVVRRNTFQDCGLPANDNKDHAIYAAHTSGVRILGNEFVNPTGQALQLYPDAQNTRVLHNVIVGGADTVRGGIVIGGDDEDASHGNLVARNVIAYTAADGVYSYWPGPVGIRNVVRDNCLWGIGGDAVDSDDGGMTAFNNVVADPQFRDREGGDLRLGADSPCRALTR